MAEEEEKPKTFIPRRWPNVMDLLRAIWVEFEMDFDGEITITIPEDHLSEQVADNLEKILKCWKGNLESQYRSQCEEAIRVYVGGPMHNKPISWESKGTIMCHRVARAKWATYEVRYSGGRACFLGYAHSEFKAKKRDIYEPARKAQ